jgi:hypothetical protein
MRGAIWAMSATGPTIWRILAVGLRNITAAKVIGLGDIGAKAVDYVALIAAAAALFEEISIAVTQHMPSEPGGRRNRFRSTTRPATSSRTRVTFPTPGTSRHKKLRGFDDQYAHGRARDITERVVRGDPEAMAFLSSLFRHRNRGCCG